MKVVLAKRIGFCFGVKRAIDMAENALRENERVCSLGSIIHNAQVVDGLSRKGLEVIKDIDRIKAGAVVASSHGISPKIAGRIKEKRLKLIDTTCPFVLNAQRIARSLSDAGYSVIIVGDANHPEVKALVDFASKDVFVVKDAREARALKLNQNGKFSIISQTTQSTDNFLDAVKAILEKMPKELRVINTICRDVEERQGAARALAKGVDAILVIGGRNSANTKRLFEICKRISGNSHLVETEKELKRSWFKGARVIGITSGASTPDWIVRRVVGKITKKGAV